MKDQIEKFLKDIQVLAIVCNQWGDTGKGKFVDVFAEMAHIITRGNGGANAGHTISINGEKYTFHLIPSGILYDSEGKINVIGPGVAFDAGVAKEELESLSKNGKTYNNLLIAYNAKLVLPQHLVMDRIKDRKGIGTRINTTGKGIGPAYADHYARTGLVINDMLNKDILRKKLERNLEDKIIWLKSKDPVLVKEVLHQNDLEKGLFYDSENIFNIDNIVGKYFEYGKFFREMITDTNKIMRDAVNSGKRILLEGAQGLLLSIDYGTYPYVTSSDCSIEGLSKGAGIHEKDVDLVLGMVKAFYMTRVGNGPFPTELGGKDSEDWCENHKKQEEKEIAADINDKEEYKQGIAIRQIGEEYGATTGRPRRTGWLDLPLLRYAIITNGPNVILSKLDVLDECKEIKICDYYEYDGPDYNIGNRILKKGERLDVACIATEVLKNCKPSYKVFEGWLSDISQIKSYDKLPKKLTNIIDYVEKSAGVNVKMLSVGTNRNQTIIKD